jgi:formate dehydrogenase
MMRPYFQHTDAVVPPVGESREEFEIVFELARRMGMGAPTASKLRRRLGRLGVKVSPLQMIDLALRLGPAGDRFGLRRGGLSMAALKRNPHGLTAQLPAPHAAWREHIQHPDGRIHVWAPEFAREIAAVLDEPSEDAQVLRLVGRRDIRSLNSWMHNVTGLTRSQTPALMMHADDARARGLSDGDLAHVSRPGQAEQRILARVKVTDEVVKGAVCYPHGWGHAGGWNAANATPGVNVNLLVETGAQAVEALSSTTILDALPVEVTRAPDATAAE